MAGVAQQACNLSQMRFFLLQGLQDALAVGDLGRGYGKRMGQALSVHCNVVLDAWDLCGLWLFAKLAVGRLHLFFYFMMIPARCSSGLRQSSIQQVYQ